VAQDAPLGALPTQFNPAFAGEAGSPRISSSLVYRSRQEWQRIPATQMVASYPYRMFQASTAYDQFVPALRSGVGIATSHTSGATPYHTFTAHSVSLAVASKFSVRGKYTFSPSLDVEYGWLRESREAQPGVMWHDDMEAHWIRSRAGLLFNTDKYYVGYSAVVLQGPSWRYPYIGRKSGLYGIYLSHLQVGYTFGSSTGSKFSFTPQLALRIGEQGRYSPHSTRYVGSIRGRGVGVEAFSLGCRYKQFALGRQQRGRSRGLANGKAAGHAHQQCRPDPPGRFYALYRQPVAAVRVQGEWVMNCAGNGRLPLLLHRWFLGVTPFLPGPAGLHWGILPNQLCIF
jgi:hypothetical protein